MTVTGGASPVGPSHPATAEEPTPQQPPDESALDAAEAVVPAPSRSTSGDRTRARLLFAELAASEPESTERNRLRDELVEMHLPLVEYLARRFRNRGEPLDDLVQVATIGLIKSVDRFDLERGVEFSTYATPTIVGEIKRHFRDKGWAIRVPRRLQELRMLLGSTRRPSELSSRLGRSPTVARAGRAARLIEEEVLEGLESATPTRHVSLDAAETAATRTRPPMLDAHRRRRRAPRARRDRESIKPLLDQLAAAREADPAAALLRQHDPVADRRARSGISQMHVSRLLARTLTQLRAGLARRRVDPSVVRRYEQPRQAHQHDDGHGDDGQRHAHVPATALDRRDRNRNADDLQHEQRRAHPAAARRDQACGRDNQRGRPSPTARRAPRSTPRWEASGSSARTISYTPAAIRPTPCSATSAAAAVRIPGAGSGLRSTCGMSPQLKAADLDSIRS